MKKTKHFISKMCVLITLLAVTFIASMIFLEAEDTNVNDEAILAQIIEQHPEATKKPDVVWKDGKITRLDWGGANLKGDLTIAGLSNLTMIYCTDNQLTSLSVSDLPELHSLFCDDNELVELNVSSVPKLYNLFCSNNQLTSLELVDLANLVSLCCNNNNLTKLQLSNLPKLQSLFCENNQLTSLPLTGLKNLASLRCFNNQLTSLNFKDTPKLLMLECYNNQLTSLNLKNLKKLSQVNCSNNKLTSLSIGTSETIQYLCCEFNNLKSLSLKGKLSKNYAQINVVGNSLKALNVTGNKGKNYILADKTTKVTKKKSDIRYNAHVIKKISKSITVKKGDYIILAPTLLTIQEDYTQFITSSAKIVQISKAETGGGLLGSAIYAKKKGTTTITVACNDGIKKSFKLIIK